MHSQATSAFLTKEGLPKNTCKLGAGSMSKEEASCLSHAGHSVPLSITDGRGYTGFYWLCCFEVRGELHGYRLREDTEEGVAYDVPVDLSSCECLGFAYHGHCKHVKTLRVLRERGLIR